MQSLKLGKKAENFFIPIVTLAGIGALIFFLIHFTASLDGSADQPIGTYASAIYLTNQEAEKAQTFIDQSASLSLQESLLNIGENGGFIFQELENNNCGQYLFALWNNESITCFPDQQDSLKQVFEKQLYSFISINPYINVFPNYQHSITSQEGKTTMAATTKDYLNIPISTDYRKQTSQKFFQTQKCNVQLERISPQIDCIAKNCLLNPETNALLEQTAQSLENQGYVLKIVQAYRTIQEQQALYESCQNLPCQTEIETPTCNAPFVSGGAISILIYKTQNNQILNTGKQGINNEYQNYNFAESEKQQQEIIEQLMCSNGWTRKGNTARTTGNWWQYEYKTSRWSLAQQKMQKTGQTVCAIE